MSDICIRVNFIYTYNLEAGLALLFTQAYETLLWNRVSMAFAKLTPMGCKTYTVLSSSVLQLDA